MILKRTHLRVALMVSTTPLLTIAGIASAQVEAEQTTPAGSGKATPAPAYPQVLTEKPPAADTTAPGTAAPSQDAPAGAETVGDIIVTARLRQESLLNVPVAVTALASADLTRYGAPDLKKVANLVPQLLIAEAPNGAGATFTIRGIGSSALDAGVEQSVSINLDGVQMSRGRILRLGMFDLQQIEVLKGPQALFFGKNSPAGVISITTADPGDKLEGYVIAGYEFVADERYVEAAVGGPVTDTLGIRIAGRFSDMEGYARNDALPLANPYAPGFPFPGAADSRQPGNREVLGRFTAVWNPTDAFTARLKVSHAAFRTNSEVSTIETICPGVSTSSGIVDPYDDCKVNLRRASTAMPQGFAVNFPDSNNGIPFGRQDTTTASLALTYKFGNMQLTSNTGFFEYKERGFDNFVQSSVGRVWSSVNDFNRQFSQQVRLETDFDGPINVMTGVYYDDFRRSNLLNTMLAFVGADPVTGRFYSFSRLGRLNGNTISGFGQVRYDPVEQVELSAGVRYTEEKKHLPELQNIYVHSVLSAAFPLRRNITSSFSDHNWSPEATVTWHPTPSQTVYAAYKTGYLSGGFSQPQVLQAANNAGNTGFGSETVGGFEVGYKARLLDNALRLELVGYRYNFEDLQQLSFEAQSVSFFVRNAGKARTSGVEFSSSWRAAAGLEFRGALAYNEAKFVSYPAAPCYAGQTAALGCVASVQDLSGRTLPRAPKWDLNLGTNYDFDLTSQYSASISADTKYQSRYTTSDNLNPVGVQGAFWLFNASARVRDERSGVELALIGRNLTNKIYFLGTADRPFARPGELTATAQRPREVIVQASIRF